MKKFLLFLFILALINNLSFAQNYRQVKIQLADISEVEAFYSAGYDFDHPQLTKDNSLIVFVDEDDYGKLARSNYNFEVLVDDWNAYYQNFPELSKKEKQQALIRTKNKFNVSGFGFGSMGGFYTFEELIAELDSMRILFPRLITEKVEIGSTLENRPIYMVKISNNPEMDEDEPEVLYTALHHAREPAGMMQMIYYMYYLLENYDVDPEITYLVNNREMYFIPVVNPDGYEYNRKLYPNGGGMWKKNRRSNVDGTYGVDLDKNFGPYVYWNSPNGGSSNNPGSDLYRGIAPFSESETSAIQNLLSTRNIKGALNYHAYGNLLLFPHGALDTETSDSLTFREFAVDMSTHNGYVYGTEKITSGFSTRGNSNDYFYDGDTLLNKGKILAMTMEVGDHLDGYWPSQSRIIQLVEESVFPNLYYARAAGEFVEIDHLNFNKQFFNAGDVVAMNSTFKNKGLSDISSIKIQLNSLNSYVSINNGNAGISEIKSRNISRVSSPFIFSIDANAPPEEKIDLEFVISAGGNIINKDTVSLFVGTPAFVFVDTTNNPNDLWELSSSSDNQMWQSTTTDYYSLPNSYTTGRNGNYSNDAVGTMTMINAVDLSSFKNPKLVFWSKWDIEDNWDYGQVAASTNDGDSWIPLKGKYTEQGEGNYQPNGEPVYDGIQNIWIREEINLAEYVSNKFKLRFKLRSDGSISRAGWYLDDIGIIGYASIPVEVTSFSAEARIDEVILKWSTSSELDNKGFEIERATEIDKDNWAVVGFVNGSGTVKGEKEYLFVDRSPERGVSYYRLKQYDLNGTFRVFSELKVDFRGIKSYELGQNFPNPFNPTTTITYSIPVGGHVSLIVYNLLGSEVIKLVDEQQQAGTHSIHFSTEDLGENIGSGIYFYTFKSGNFTETRKMIVLK